jgi:hypothetical protein
MSLSEILFPDAKNSCTQKTTTNQKAKNGQMSKLLLSATLHGAKRRANSNYFFLLFSLLVATNYNISLKEHGSFSFLVIKWLPVYLITRKMQSYAHVQVALLIQALISRAMYFAPGEKPLKKFQPKAAIAQAVRLQKNMGLA